MRQGLLVVLLVALCVTLPAEAFTPGHIYMPSRTWDSYTYIFEWDQNFQLVGQTPFLADEATGAVFNDAGNLVVVAKRDDYTRVLELNSAGQTVREYDTGIGGLLRGSYIDYDPMNNRYAVATNNNVTILDENLQFVTTVGTYDRAYGVAFGPDGKLYTSGDDGSKLTEFSADLQTSRSLGPSGYGIDVSNDNTILMTQFGVGRVDEIDISDGSQTTFMVCVDYCDISGIVQMPDGRVLLSGLGSHISMYSSAGVLLGTSEQVGWGDSVAFLVPEPATMLLLGFGVPFLVRRGPRSQRAR